MNLKLLLLLLFTSFTTFVSAQEYLFGQVSSEFGNHLANAVVYNTATDEKVCTNNDGHFMIKASVNDKLRFVKSGYERYEVSLQASDFTQPLNIILTKSAVLIPEVELGFVPTGNIAKDTKALNPPKKVVALNDEVQDWMKEPPIEEYSQNPITPSAFQNEVDFSKGDLMQLVGAAIGFIKKKVNPETSPNYAETEAFYKRVKQEIDLDYFRNHGLDDYAIERFLAYAESVGQLSKKYRKTFNKSEIMMALRGLFSEYILLIDSVS